jgi:hypothetical protein
MSHNYGTLGVRELVRFAHDAQDGQTVYPGVQVEFGERVYAPEVHVSFFGEGGQSDGADAG